MASYEHFKASIQEAEGGYQNLVNDKGNYNSLKQRVGTNYGVSAKFYERVIGFPPSMEDMKAITQQEAHMLFKNEFWDKMGGDNIDNQAVAELIVDHAINANPYVTAKMIQRTLNTDFNKGLVVDGVVGAKTIAALNSVDQYIFFQKFADARLAYYKRLKDFQYFGNSWTSRVYKLAEKFGVAIKKKRP